MSKRVLVGGCVGLLVLSGCAMQRPAQATANGTPVTPITTSTSSATAVVESASPSTSSPAPSPTPAAVTPTPTPSPSASTSSTKPTATATATTPAAPPKPPTAAESMPGFGTTVRYKSTGKAVTTLQTLLKKLGYYPGTVNGSANTGTINGILNFQRAQGVEDSGIAAAETWARLANPQPVPTALPGSCYGNGVTLCVSRAQRKLFFIKNGAIVKTIKVRLGGWNDTKEGTMRVHQTVRGTYTVYRKDPNPSSPRYGEGAMPYSVMFDPNMYVHYSAGFASVGYLGSSHGCVNVGSLSEAKWIYANTPVGAKVVVF